MWCYQTTGNPTFLFYSAPMKYKKNSIKNIQDQFNLIVHQNADHRPIIAVYGLMNAGKSFLLNMLTQHIDVEFFKTNDVRETSEIKSFESDKYIYLDTPGLDANQADDARAQFGASQADIVLFVHQPQGELEANEVEMLNELKKTFGIYAESNIVLVISKIEKEDPEKINQIEEKIKIQCVQKIGFSPKVFQVSNKRYQSGVKKHSNGLIAQSHIKSLIEHLDLVAMNSEKVRAQRKLIKVEALLRVIEEEGAQLRKEKQKLMSLIDKSLSTFNKQVDLLNGFLEDRASKYRNI